MIFLVIKILVLIMTFGVPFFIFFDYHKKKNIHRSVYFLIIFFGGILIGTQIIKTFGYMSLLLFTPLPFIVALIGKDIEHKTVMDYFSPDKNKTNDDDKS